MPVVSLTEDNGPLSRAGETLMRHHGAGPETSSNGSAWTALSGSATGWEAERMAVAIDRLGVVNRSKSSDSGLFVLSGTRAPTEVNSKSGGVYQLPGTGGAGTGVITLGKSATQVLIGAPKAESWYVAARVMFGDPFLNAGGVFSIPIGIDQAGGHATYIIGRGTVSTTVFQLEMVTGATVRTPLGSVGTLGSLTAPLDSFFTVSMYFKSSTGELSVEFSDQIALRTSSLGDMSAGAGIVASQANDETRPMQWSDIFWAGVAAAL